MLHFGAVMFGLLVEFIRAIVEAGYVFEVAAFSVLLISVSGTVCLIKIASK